MNKENLEVLENEELEDQEIEDMATEDELNQIIEDFDQSINYSKRSSSTDPTTMYLNDIARTPRLSKEDQLVLFKKLRTLDSTKYEYKNIRDTLINTNMRLVASIALKYTNRGLELVDLINEGSLGLLRAVDKFDPSKNCAFSTYAYSWIKLSMDIALQKYGNLITVPMWIKVKITQMIRAEYKISQDQHIMPDEVSDEDLAAELKTDVATIRDLKMIRYKSKTINIDSINADADDDDERKFEFEDKETLSIQEEIELAERESAAIALLDSLPKKKYAEVMKMRLGFTTGSPMSLAEIGRYYESQGYTRGVTREAIRQIEEKALNILRSDEFKAKLVESGLWY